MYNLSDTIVAVSSPSSGQRVIIRITGPDTLDKINQLLVVPLPAQGNSIIHTSLSIREGLNIDATIYLFTNGRSYTAEDLLEIHFYSNAALTEAVMQSFLQNGMRLAGPGEFTARAYLNGKMDLAQAEAVNRVVTCSNRLQLSAAEKLLTGRLTETTCNCSRELMDLLSLIEAGLDFSEEDIELISSEDAAGRLEAAKQQLEGLLSGGIAFEVITDLPAVGIAGAPNAGKSSLLNAMLGRRRSIVSKHAKTTRDILTGIVELEHNRCVLFDCAGLISQPHGQIDELAQAAAIEALAVAELVLFCVDATKQNLAEDIVIRELFEPKSLVGVATKVDLVAPNASARLKDIFNIEFIPVSNTAGTGIAELRDAIDARVTEQMVLYGAAAHGPGVALTARHKQAVNQAVGNINQARSELEKGKDEVAAMMIRSAYQSLCGLQAEHIDEKILDNIFSQFCIGK